MHRPNHVAILIDRNTFNNNDITSIVKNMDMLIFHTFNLGINTLSFNISNKALNIDLFLKKFKSILIKLNKKMIRIVFSGRRADIGNDTVSLINNIEEMTKNNQKGVLNLCINYNGQEEIVDAAIKYKDVKDDRLNINDFYKYLYNDLDSVDLVIFTGGEHNLANFMLFQIANSELYFTNKNFLDFDKSEFNKAIFIYENRNEIYNNECGILNEKDN